MAFQKVTRELSRTGAGDAAGHLLHRGCSPPALAGFADVSSRPSLLEGIGPRTARLLQGSAEGKKDGVGASWGLQQTHDCHCTVSWGLAPVRQKPTRARHACLGEATNIAMETAAAMWRPAISRRSCRPRIRARPPSGCQPSSTHQAWGPNEIPGLPSAEEQRRATAWARPSAHATRPPASTVDPCRPTQAVRPRCHHPRVAERAGSGADGRMAGTRCGAGAGGVAGAMDGAIAPWPAGVARPSGTASRETVASRDSGRPGWRAWAGPGGANPLAAAGASEAPARRSIAPPYMNSAPSPSSRPFTTLRSAG
jgi:hypothetical protein